MEPIPCAVIYNQVHIQIMNALNKIEFVSEFSYFILIFINKSLLQLLKFNRALS